MDPVVYERAANMLSKQNLALSKDGAEGEKALQKLEK